MVILAPTCLILVHSNYANSDDYFLHNWTDESILVWYHRKLFGSVYILSKFFLYLYFLKRNEVAQAILRKGCLLRFLKSLKIICCIAPFVAVIDATRTSGEIGDGYCHVTSDGTSSSLVFLFDTFISFSCLYVFIVVVRRFSFDDSTRLVAKRTLIGGLIAIMSSSVVTSSQVLVIPLTDSLPIQLATVATVTFDAFANSSAMMYASQAGLKRVIRESQLRNSRKGGSSH